MKPFEAKFATVVDEWVSYASDATKRFVGDQIFRLQVDPYRRNTRANRSSPNIRSFRCGHYLIIYEVREAVRILWILEVGRKDTHARLHLSLEERAKRQLIARRKREARQNKMRKLRKRRRGRS